MKEAMATMPWTSEHLKWLVNTGEEFTTVNGKIIEVWEFRYEHDEAVLSAWAKHFRNHYCQDDEIDILRDGTGYSKADYLNILKFPDRSTGFGPGIRAGDFGEILVADYLQFVLGYWVPRTRYGNKDISNESAKGCDIIGFKVLDNDRDSSNDTLAIFEAKAQFSETNPRPRLQDAVNDSIKDHARKGESLNAIKQRLIDKQEFEEAKLIARFQYPEDRTYKEISGAAALFTTTVFDKTVIEETETQDHPNSDNLILVVIHGNAMMDLIHALYGRAADEA